VIRIEQYITGVECYERVLIKPPVGKICDPRFRWDAIDLMRDHDGLVRSATTVEEDSFPSGVNARVSSTAHMQRIPTVMARTFRIASFIAVAGLLGGATAAFRLDAAPHFDAGRLKLGHFTYQDIQDGKPGSLSTTTIARLADGHYRYTANFPEFDQSWSTIATRAMAPVETVLKMRSREGWHYQMTLAYAGHRVTGEAVNTTSNVGGLSRSSQTVAADIPDNTVDQRIDWATVMTTELKPGERFLFNVYDAKTAVSRVTCFISDAGTMTTPLGKLHAIRLNYVVNKASGTESYSVYATSTLPRIMLREDLPHGLTSQLVKVEP
jgi:hypothetical protein